MKKPYWLIWRLYWLSSRPQKDCHNWTLTEEPKILCLIWTQQSIKFWLLICVFQLSVRPLDFPNLLSKISLPLAFELHLKGVYWLFSKFWSALLTPTFLTSGPWPILEPWFGWSGSKLSRVLSSWLPFDFRSPSSHVSGKFWYLTWVDFGADYWGGFCEGP